MQFGYGTQFKGGLMTDQTIKVNSPDYSVNVKSFIFTVYDILILQSLFSVLKM
jgi:hypothetical protein